MSLAIIYVGNIVAIAVLVLGLYFRRHRRRDLVTAYFGVNIGVMAVSAVLLNGAVGLGLGLGLFGVLSIIRLRSDELAQHEVAYYFSALALGLLGGLATEPAWLTLSLMAVIVGGMYVADHPGLFGSYRREIVLLDRAISFEPDLVVALEQRLGATVKHVTVQRLDLVNDTTLVDVRYCRTAASIAAAQAPELERIR